MSILKNIPNPIVFIGNCNRIKELNEIGLRDDAIAQEFRKQGVPISVNMVRAVLNDEIIAMGTVAYSKKKVKDIRDKISQITTGITA
ncbi:hypothetical protein [Neisseria elongata]|uniref:hypothetical protein n=1 Tax=Neisseria elongata TaxID=495 RepID=UPI0024B10966|nr:hypothetical protein [Neisseria elongata]